MYSCYFDESGDLTNENSIFCISGYLLSREAALQMDEEWRKVLNEFNIPFFHMVDCAHGKKHFKKISRESRISIATKLIELIKGYTLQGFTVIGEAKNLNAREDSSDLYSEFADRVVSSYQYLRGMEFPDGPIEFFFEAGHKGQSSAYNQIARKVSQGGDTVAFMGKKEAPLLQAADFLAWQSRKYLKDKVSGEHPTRGDFLSLMEHPHDIYHVFDKDNQSQLAIEFWPLSRRSPQTEQWENHENGRIPYYTRDGNDTPIILINDVLGWGVGGLRIGLIEFGHVKIGKLQFAFNEDVLMKTTMAMLDICNSYLPPGKVMPLVPEKFVVDSAHGDRSLFVKNISGPGFALLLTDETLEDLKRQLNDL